MHNLTWNIPDIIGWHTNTVLSAYASGGKHSLKHVSSYFQSKTK